MPEQKHRRPLGFGLPECLNGLKGLEKPLGLNRQTRSRLLQCGFFRQRVGDIGDKKRADWPLLAAFYGNPDFRRELFNIHLVFRTVEKRLRVPIRTVPPSLEHKILGPFLDRNLAKPRNQGSPTEDVRTASFTAATASRIKRWSSLSDPERLEVTLWLFAKATLLDDRTVLEDVSRKVPDLGREFRDLVTRSDAGREGTNHRAGSGNNEPDLADPEVGVDLPAVLARATALYAESSGNQKLELARRLARAHETALEPGFDSLVRLPAAMHDAAALDSLHDLAKTLEGRLDVFRSAVRSRKKELKYEGVKTLRRFVLGFLDALVGDPRRGLVETESVGRLRRLWLELEPRDIEPGMAKSEHERLARSLPALAETVRETHDAHRDLEHQLSRLRQTKPEEGAALTSWADQRDDLRIQAVRARRSSREASARLLAALDPAPGLWKGEDRGTPECDPDEADEAGGIEKSAFMPRRGRLGGDSRTGNAPPREAASAEETPVDSVADLHVAVPGRDDSSIGEATGSSTSEPTPAEDAETAAPRPDAHVEESEPGASPTCQGPLPEDATDRGEWDEREQRVRDAVAEALTDDPPRLAFAHEVCRLAEESGIDAGQPPAQALAAALYASRLQRPDSPLVEPTLSALAQVQSTVRDRRDPAERNVNALIGLAGALPAAVIAPYAGATAYLGRLEHEGIEELGAFTFSVAQRLWELQKTHVDADTILRTARDRASHQDAAATFREDLEIWSEIGQERKLAYIPANRIWNVLCQDDNQIGRLTQAMRSGGQTAIVRRLAAQLADRDELRKIVDRFATALLSSQQTIDAKTLVQFRRHLEEPLSLAERYLDLEAARTPDTDHHEQVIAKFVQTLRHKSADLLQRLDAMALESGGDTLLMAASSLAAGAVRRAAALLSSPGGEDGADGQDTGFLLRSALLPFPDLAADESPEDPVAPQSTLDALLESTPLELPVAFEHYCERGDLLLAADIIDWLEAAVEEDDTRSLRNRLEEERHLCQRVLAAELLDIRQEVDLAFSKSRISANRNSSLLARLEAIQLESTENERPRYNLLRGESDAVRSDLEAAAREERDKLRQEVAASFPDDEAPLRKAIEQSLEDGDLLVANELLYRTPQDTPLPSRQSRPSTLQNYLDIDHDDLRSRVGLADNWTELIRSAASGQSHGPLRFDHLDESERASARALLEAWVALRNVPVGKPDRLARATTELMRSLGFIDPEVTFDSPVPGFVGARLKVAPIERREVCPLPHFGSEARGSYRLMLLLDPPEAEAIHQRMEQSRRQEAAIVVTLHALGRQTREQLVRSCLAKRTSLLTLDEPLLAFLAAQGGSRLAAFFACSLPYTYNQPFIRRASLVPPEMFFGRDAEAEAIANFRGSCFVYGGRQLGKTALLRHVERNYRGSGRFAIWIDLKAQGIGEIDTADIWPAIWSALRERRAIEDTVRKPTQRDESIRRFIKALHSTFNRDSGRRLLLLFDEADNFLERDTQNSSRESFAESSRLKSLMDHDQSIKVVFAGLHNVLRTTNQSNHPLAHLGNPVRIGPFIDEGNQRHALDLLQGPLQACGFRFEPERLAQRVLAGANYYPSLIQIYGDEIVARSLDSDKASVPRRITADLLDSIDRDPDLQEDIRRRFEWTLQLDPRYEAIAYAIAFECHSDPILLRHGMKDARIQRHARVWYEGGFPRLGGNMEFSSLLREMVDLGVLREIEEGGSHTLRNPNVLNLLGTSRDIENRLEDLSAGQRPLKLGPHDIRRHHVDKGPLHRPLTLWQERQVVGEPYGHGVIVLCGVEAAGIRNVGHFLAQGPIAARELPEADSVTEFKEHLRRRLQRRKRDGADTVVLTVSGNWKRDWVDVARRELEGLSARPYARVVFVADMRKLFSLDMGADIPTWDLPPPDAREATVDLAQPAGRAVRAQTVFRAVRLEPWTLGFAAKWLDDEPDIGHKLTSDQESELALEAGGWPVLLELIRRGIKRDGPKGLLEAGGMHELMKEYADELRGAFGLDRPVLRDALRQVEVDSGRETSDHRPRPVREDEQNRLFGGAAQISLSEEPGPVPGPERTQAQRLLEMLRLVTRDGEEPLCVDPVVRAILDLSVS